MKRFLIDMGLALIIMTVTQIVIAVIAGILGREFESVAINFLIAVYAFRLIEEVRGE